MNARFLRCLLHFLPVLVQSGQKIHRAARAPHVPRHGVSQHLLVSMPQVRRSIRVINGSSKIKRLQEMRVFGVQKSEQASRTAQHTSSILQCLLRICQPETSNLPHLHPSPSRIPHHFAAQRQNTSLALGILRLRNLAVLDIHLRQGRPR